MAVGSGDRSADEVLDCTGCAVLPGLINLHNHVANTLLRGAADDVPLEEMLSKAASLDAKFTRRDVQVGSLLGCVEMIRSGTTSFHDLFYWEDEVARAVRETGLRGFLSWVTLDESRTTQHGNPVKNADGFVAKHKGDALVTPSVGVQGVYAASQETFLKAKELAERHKVRMHMHLAETRGEVERHRKETGLRPTEWLERVGFLDPRLTAAHGVWTTINEVRTLARHGVSVAHCPVSGPVAQGDPVGRAGDARADGPRPRHDRGSPFFACRFRTRFDRGRKARGPRGRVPSRGAYDSFLSGDPHQPSRLQLPGE